MNRNYVHFLNKSRQMGKASCAATPWSASTKICIPLRIRALLDRMQRRWNGGHKTLDVYMSNLDNILVRLPAEIILAIASFLDIAGQVLLSLSSKRLRVILTEHIDLSFKIEEQRLSFLLSLEKDFPRYLTCRTCVSMFKWRSRNMRGYVCHNDRRSSKRFRCHSRRGQFICHCERVRVTRESVDLILKAWRRGPEYGLPASHLDHECSESNSYSCSFPTSEHRRFEGRIVSGHFFLAVTHTFTGPLAKMQSLRYETFRSQICCDHFWRLSWDDILAQQSEPQQEIVELKTVKCRYCAIDYRATAFLCKDHNTIRVELRLWRNYGSCDAELTSAFGSHSDFDANEPPDYRTPVFISRDLEQDFNAGKLMAVTNHHSPGRT